MDRLFNLFSNSSNYADSVDFAFAYITIISIIMLVGISATVILFVYKYHEKKHPRPIQTHGNVFIEIIWIVIPTILVISMYFVSTNDYIALRQRADIDIEIDVEARMYSWAFTYENGHVSDTLYVPVGKTIKFNLTSADVIHSFYIPALRIKEDCVNNRSTFMIVQPEKTGEYVITCAEYCGILHWDMMTKYIVVDEQTFQTWVESGSNDTADDEVSVDADSEYADN